MSDDAINVLIGGAIGFAGVILSQVFAWVLLRKQQTHEARERRYERDYQVKKDLYLNLAEEYSRLLINMGDLPNKTFTPTLVTEITTPFSMALTKSHLVANGATAQALDALLVEVQKIIQDTGMRLTDLWSVQFELDNTIILYDKYSSQNDEILRDMGRVNLNPNEHMEIQLSYLSDKFENNKKITEPFAAERRELNATLARKKFDYTRNISKHVIELEETSLPAFKAIREELGLPWSEEYIASRKETLEVVKKSLKKFLREMEKKVEAELKPEETTAQPLPNSS